MGIVFLEIIPAKKPEVHMKKMFSVVDCSIMTLPVDAVVCGLRPFQYGGIGIAPNFVGKEQMLLLKEDMAFINAGEIEVGKAKMVRVRDLPSSYVVLTHEPQFNNYVAERADELLAGCYFSSLRLATRHRLMSVAFPEISTGLYGYSKERAAQVAIGSVLDFLKLEDCYLQQIFFAAGSESANIYRTLLEKLI